MIPFVGSSGLALAMLLLSAGPLSAAPADVGHPRRSKPIVELYTLFSTDDYPAEAIANGEQGTVAFDLSIGLDGRVSDCLITSSSGSPVLDATSCQLLVERARFEPATDASGKPVVDSHTSRIVWRLPEEGEPPSSITAAVRLWSACVSGEAAKLTVSAMPAPDVARRALGACAQLEALATSEMTRAELEGLDASTAIPAIKAQFSKGLMAQLERMRLMLKDRE
jgi:TonB family protein